MSFKKIVSYVSLILLTSCTTGIKNTQYEVAQGLTSPSPNLGVVFGRICEGNGLRFQASNGTGEVFTHVGGTTLFLLQLPPGRYKLISIGSSRGRMLADDPLQFDVVIGEVRYLGSILPRWYQNGISRFPEGCNEEENAIVKSSSWALENMFRKTQPIWKADIADLMPVAVVEAKKYNPSFDFSKAKRALMQ